MGVLASHLHTLDVVNYPPIDTERKSEKRKKRKKGSAFIKDLQIKTTSNYFGN